VTGKLNVRFIGVELYFEDLKKGMRFYGERFGFRILDEESGHYARYDTLPAFICLERKGSETYPSLDNAVLFLEVPNLLEAVESIGRDLILEMKPAGEGKRRPWAALHDPEGYNIVLLEPQRIQLLPNTGAARATSACLFRDWGSYWRSWIQSQW
jgi:predicted enzyme related to lactoylglutathione lyase